MSRSSEENRTLPELWLNSPSAVRGGKLVDLRPDSHHRSHETDSFLDGVLFCLTFSVSSVPNFSLGSHSSSAQKWVLENPKWSRVSAYLHITHRSLYYPGFPIFHKIYT